MPARRDGWARAWRARTAVLATIGPSGEPHLVPCCFALEGPVLYSAVDDKPKSSTRLQRVENVTLDARVVLLFESYSEDWGQLWWFRASGRARLVDGGAEHDGAVRLLVAKYPQYFSHALDATVIAADLAHWRGWAASLGGAVTTLEEP